MNRRGRRQGWDRLRDWRFVKEGQGQLRRDHAVAGHKGGLSGAPLLGVDDAGERRIVFTIERHPTGAIGAAGGAPWSAAPPSSPGRRPEAPSLRLVEGLAQSAALKENPPQENGSRGGLWSCRCPSPPRTTGRPTGSPNAPVPPSAVVPSLRGGTEVRARWPVMRRGVVRAEVRAAARRRGMPEAASSPALFGGGETIELGPDRRPLWMDRFRATESITRI